MEDIDYLRQNYHYNPHTGAIWKRSKNASYWYELDLTPHHTRENSIYYSVHIHYPKPHQIKAHRLAWFLYYGVWPVMLDHANRNGLDNRLCNLRLATNSQNSANTKTPKHNTSGYKGVSFDRLLTRKPWRAMISYNHKRYRARFDTPEAAARWYDDMARSLFGPFAKVNFSGTS